MSTHASPSFFATCAKGLEDLLAHELRALGLLEVRETRAGAAFAGAVEDAYRACLWSRVASRVLLPLAHVPAGSAEALYEGVRAIPWEDHLSARESLAVSFTGVNAALTHTHFGALKVKDAIVDRLRERTGARPNVDTERPSLRVNVHLDRDQAQIAVDLAGDALHRRGYRVETVAAPLKENLAAAVLLRAGWPAVARAGSALVDPLCGSGTLVIEAALMAADVAPGLFRDYYGFIGWKGHDAAAWARLLDEARARRDAGLGSLPPISGYDSDTHAIRAARANAARAGLLGRVRLERRALEDCVTDAGAPGLVVANPPYGERLGEAADLGGVYRALGEALKRCYPGFRAAVLTGAPDLARQTGLRAHKLHTLYNGAIECKLLHFEVTPERYAGADRKPVELGPGAVMFENRLRKNLKALRRWAAREGVECYRLYDADMPEYNLAVDLYTSRGVVYAHVQEYEAPSSVDPRAAKRRLNEALETLPKVLEIPRERMFTKLRRRQRHGAQYQGLARGGEYYEVREGPARLLVNFTDHLDTGLFLDHRDTRALIGRLASGRRFLNLFSYTGSASVHAALGGATSTTTVDMSRTYLDWARRNLELNGLSGARHAFVHADVMEWLGERRRERYDLVFLDPPTFSRSKRMQGTLDVQRDHVALIRAAHTLLDDGGILIFSTNLRRFKLDRATFGDLAVEDITRATLPHDFARNPRVHACFRIEKAARTGA